MEINFKEDQNLPEFIKEKMSRHPLFDIIQSVIEHVDSSSEEDDLSSWSLICFHVNSILRGNSIENSDRHAEGWLFLGELRCQVRIVANYDPDTKEEDEIFYRENPGKIISDFETFIGMIVAALNEYAQSEALPKHLIN